MSMSKGSWAATEADSVIVAADENVDEVRIQVLSGGPIYLAFGEAAVAGKGLYVAAGGSYMVDDHRARMALHAICGAGQVAAGGYQSA
mgnify:FL=1